AAQVGVAQVGAVQVGADQVGAAQVGVAQVGAAQVGVAQVGVDQVGAAQVGVAQVGAAQVGVAQVGASLHRLPHRAPQLLADGQAGNVGIGFPGEQHGVRVAVPDFDLLAHLASPCRGPGGLVLRRGSIVPPAGVGAMPTSGTMRSI